MCKHAAKTEERQVLDILASKSLYLLCNEEELSVPTS